jgi:chemotaxis protein methyltransferase CheR
MSLLSDFTFQRYSDWMKLQTGVHLPPSKKPLVQQRLYKRLMVRGMPSLDAYYKLLIAPEEEQERQIAIDLLTTHETYFFREQKHFEWLKNRLKTWPRSQVFHVWCAAASSGEEVWSLAMLLAEILGQNDNWSILGSDISKPVLDQAQAGHYPMSRCKDIPDVLLRRYCLKGKGRQEGTLLVAPHLRKNVSFQLINLDQNLPPIGPFDLVFIRNVLIYFNNETKEQVIARVMKRMNAEAHLVVSHSESLHSLQLPLTLLAPGIYRKLP